MIDIKFPDGSVRAFEKGVTGYEIAKSISPRLAEEVLAIAVKPAGDTTIGKGVTMDLNRPIEENSSIVLLKWDDDEAKRVFWHSSSHLMAEALEDLFPGVKFGIGPAVENGFYYDVDLGGRQLTDTDFPKIEKRMLELAREKQAFVRQDVSKAEAMKHFEETGDKYKCELISELEDGHITYYTNGHFTDLCRGPHLRSTEVIKAVKLTALAGAYWRGDEKREQLTRIYGITFPKKSMLDEYLVLLEEAKKRDHRKLGKELELFTISEEVGQGLVLWLPKGAKIRKLIENFWSEEHEKAGYEFVYTPHIGKANLWETSGHLGFYKDNMYSPIDIEGQQYFIKPMNCPFHIAIYKNSTKSYRDLPIRYCEEGTVYRYERSGTLHGLTRVRGFTQDDAHLFCREDQMPAEIDRVVEFSIHILRSFGFQEFSAYLSTKPEKSVGDPERWEAAEAALEASLKRHNLPYEVDEGGGAFYGPKIDFKVNDAIGREWQLSTIQFDFNLPERFDVTYVGEDGQLKRPYMIHRALLGSLERFFGVLIEHYAGAFPAWLAPIQVELIPIADRHIDYAKEVADQLRANGIRCEVNAGSDRMNAKIRDAQKQKIPYMLILGDKEAEEKGVSLRMRSGENPGAMSVDEFIALVKKQVAEKI